MLYQTEGFARRQNVTNQTYAIYHYRQSLIHTNTNLPFFVASPKLFALMNDTNAPVRHETIGGDRVPIRTVNLNEHDVRLIKLGDIAEIKQGLTIGDNKAFLFQNPEAHGSYRSIDDFQEFLLTENDLERIRSDESLRAEVLQYGISKDDTKYMRYFGRRYIAPFDKGGGESDSDEGWMPNYYVPTNYYIDWSEWAVKDLNRRANFSSGVSGKTFFRNKDYYFCRGLSYSFRGVYAPTFRLGSGGIIDVNGPNIFISDALPTTKILGILTTKVLKAFFKGYIQHTVASDAEPLAEVPLPLIVSNEIQKLSEQIIEKQHQNLRYDYATHEQIEIDRLVYEAYGLNEVDIREVEDWFARRYPTLAAAQRRNLAAAQGRTETQLIARTTLHLLALLFFILN